MASSGNHAGIGNINDVFNVTVRHKRLTGTRHMTRADLAIDYYNTNLKVEPSKIRIRMKEIEVWYQQYNRRTHERDDNAHGRAHMRT